MIVFPAIDLRRGRCVRLRQGRAADETVYGQDPAAIARQWVDQGAAWLHVVNLDGALGEADSATHLRRLSEISAAVPGAPVQCPSCGQKRQVPGVGPPDEPGRAFGHGRGAGRGE